MTRLEELELIRNGLFDRLKHTVVINGWASSGLVRSFEELIDVMKQIKELRTEVIYNDK